jgi:hypothetical protein
MSQSDSFYLDFFYAFYFLHRIISASYTSIFLNNDIQINSSPFLDRVCISSYFADDHMRRGLRAKKKIGFEGMDTYQKLVEYQTF